MSDDAKKPVIASEHVLVLSPEQVLVALRAAYPEISFEAFLEVDDEPAGPISVRWSTATPVKVTRL